MSQYNWDVNIAMAIMQAENHTCNPSAYNGVNANGSNDAGLFQVNSIHVLSGLIGDQERFNPEANIKAAYAIYRGSGWSAWATYNNGIYLEYLRG